MTARAAAPRDDPRIAGALLAALLVVQFLRLGAWEAWAHAVVHLLTAAALAVAALRASRGAGLVLPPLGLWAGLWAAASLASAFASPFPGAASRGLLADLSGAALFFLAAWALRAEPASLSRWKKWLAGPPLLFAAALLAWALAGLAGGVDLFRQRLGGGLLTQAFQNVNVVAGVFVLAAPLAAGLVVDRSAPRWERVLWGAGLAAAAVHVLAWRSLMAVVVLGAQALFLRERSRPARPGAGRAAAAFALPAALLLAWGAWSKWTAPARRDERVHWAICGLRVFLDRPLLGAGPGAFGEAFPGHRGDASAGQNTLYSHNVIVDLLAERGLAGTVPFLFLLGAFFNRVRSRRGDAAAAAAAAGFLVFNLVHVGFSVPALQALFWAALGLATDPREKARSLPAPAAPLALAAASALLSIRSFRVCRAEELAFAGHAALQAGDAPGALPLLRSSIRWDPRWSESRGLMAEVLWAAGDAEAAGREARRAVDLSPFAARHRQRLGRMLLQEGSLPAALAAAERACRYNPIDGKNWFLKGKVLEALGRPAEAAAAFDQVDAVDLMFYRRTSAVDPEQRRLLVESARREAAALREGLDAAPR